MLDIIDKEDMKHIVRRKRYEGKCCICRSSETYITPSGRPLWFVHKCDKEYCTERLCKSCYTKDYNKKPDSYNNYVKSMANSRTNLSIYDDNGKAIIGQWIVAKTTGRVDLNIERNNFSEPVDLSGYIDVKTASMVDDRWQFGNKKRKKRCDAIFFVCMDDNKPWKDVKEVYYIPYYKIIDELHLYIYKDWSNASRFRWIEEYRVDEQIYNDIYHTVDIPEFFNPFDLWNGMYNKSNNQK